ncbi:YjiH family protein [Alteribacillus sp. HJP-4]
MNAERPGEKQEQSYSKKGLWMFLLPSLVGVLLFLVPYPQEEAVTIGVGALANWLEGFFGNSLPAIMTYAICFSAGISILFKLYQPAWFKNNLQLQSIFKVSIFSILLRTAGAVFAVLTILEAGPAVIHSEATGGTILFSLITVLGTFFLAAGFFLPFLTEFGLMEFVGNQFRKIMKPLFRLPGRASIDTLASWVGNGPLGVLITTKQYEEGYYTKREATTIATTFSVASIPFTVIIISFVELQHIFLQFYFCVVLSGIAAAVICPRIPPLSRKADTYDEEAGKQIIEERPVGMNSLQFGLQQGIKKAQNVKGPKDIFSKGAFIVADIWFGLIPVVMAVGTIFLITAEYTEIFTFLSYPLIPLLTVLGVPEASAAAPALLVGFADMFLPVIFAGGIESELTRFLIAVISVNQLIYMSEIGVLLLRSKIPVGIGELFVIFLERTIITLLVTVLAANMFFY